MSHWHKHDFSSDLILPHFFQLPRTYTICETHRTSRFVPPYSITSQRTQTLLNLGRKLVLRHNVWHTAVDSPPWSPCPSKLMDTNMPLHENVSWQKQMEMQKYKKIERGNGAKMTLKSIRGGSKGRNNVSKNAYLLMPCTYTLTSTSARRITSLSENALCEHAKKMNLSHCFFLSCPFSFPIVSDTQQSLKGKKRGFPISASKDTLGSWTWVHCSVEQGMFCCKWRPKSILQAELLTTHIPKNLTVHKREEGWNKERSRED